MILDRLPLSDHQKRDLRWKYPKGYLKRRLTAHKRALPDFVCLGVMKAGTTSFYSYLSQHPDVLPAHQKAVRYFNHFLPMGEQWYRSFFPYPEAGKITGEASPLYFWADEAPAAMKALVPNAKLIVILREPISRAYSQYNMQAHQDGNPGFETAIDPEGDNYCEPRRHYLERGHYAKTVKKWFEYFPKEQFLFLKYEEFFSEPNAGLAEVYDFLGLSHDFPADLTPQVVGKYSKLKKETLEKLEPLYAESNAELVELLGPRFIW